MFLTTSQRLINYSIPIQSPCRHAYILRSIEYLKHCDYAERDTYMNFRALSRTSNPQYKYRISSNHLKILKQETQQVLSEDFNTGAAVLRDLGRF